MKKFLAFVGLLFILGLIFIVVIESLIIYFAYRDRIATKGDKIGLVRIKGIIRNSETTIKILKKCGKRKDIKGIVLRIESPGGSVAAVQEIYEEVLAQEKKGKKVVASLGNVAASGGYYVALACDKIYANPGTLTGSIGVIINVFNLQGLMENWGIQLNSIASGQYKTTGSVTREMTPEEEELLRNLVNNVHRQFVAAVKDRRHLSDEALNNLTDGRVLTGSQAYEVKLIDGLGSLEKAIHETAGLCGIKEKPNVIEFKEKGIDSFLEASANSLQRTFQLMKNPKRFNLSYSLN
jgi:protease-4